MALVPKAASSRAADGAPPPPRWLRGRLKPVYPLYRAFELWSDADGLRMSAAMSFYGILSLAPLLVLIVAVLGWWLDRELLESSLIAQIGGLVGQQGAEVIEAAIASAREPGQGLLASLLAFALLLMGATGVFAELQSAIERLWRQGTGTAAAGAFWHTATLRVRGVAYILAFGFLMLVSTALASLLSLLQDWVDSRFDMRLLLVALNQILSFLITTGLFVALMRMSAGPQPRLRHLVRGAAVGALLFGGGKYALALYLSTAATVSAYGAAGSLVVLLMWIYFASAVLLFGASVARVSAEQGGEFSSAAVPPPAAAADAPAPPATVPARAVLRPTAPAAWTGTEGLAVLISVAAAFALTRPSPARAARAPADAARPTVAPRRWWPGAGRAAARDIAQDIARDAARALVAGAGAWRLLRALVGERQRVTQRPAPWAGRLVGDAPAPGLGTRWRQWRQRMALAQAQHALASDLRALREAARRRR